MNEFDKCIDFVLKWEGGYSNDPDDPGGETKYGISKRWHPELNIKDLTKEEAKSIYKKEYWDTLGLDAFEPSTALAIFDSAVNCGIGGAKEFAQDCNGEFKKVIDARFNHYSKIIAKKPGLKKFLNGWQNRLLALTDKCNQLTRSV